MLLPPARNDASKLLLVQARKQIRSGGEKRETSTNIPKERLNKRVVSKTRTKKGIIIIKKRKVFRQILDFTKEFSVLIVSQYDDFRQN